MKLVIIESPNKIKKLRQILGREYQIVPTIGHFRDLPRSGLNVDTKTFEVNWEIAADKAKVVAEMKEAAAKAEQIFLATDPDREGEAISWHVAQVLEIKNPLRAEFNEITKAAVQKAMEKPRPLDEGLVEAQQARRILDRLVGYIVSPELRELGDRLSAGRVQSCVLHLICSREQEREAFDVRRYWTIQTTYDNGLAAGLAEVGDDGRLRLTQFESEEEAANIVKLLNTVEHRVSGVDGSDVERKPKPPFETSSLLKAAGLAFGWKSDRTTKIAQELFESGLITYPRTDSLNVSPEAQELARAILAKRFPDALPDSPPTYRSKAGAQEAHECIRPTDPADEAPQGMTREQADLYALVWKRFLASQAKPARFAKTLVSIAAGDRILRAIGMQLMHSGFLAIGDVADDESQGEEGQIPRVEIGDVLTVAEVKSDAKKTSPPPRFKESTLIEAMKKLGIGRPSTYSSTLKVLFTRSYIQLEAKRKNPAIVPTVLGRQVDDYLMQGVPELLEPTYTASMEESLDEIAERKKAHIEYLREWYADFDGKLVEARRRWNSRRQAADGASAEPACPRCHARMRKRKGPYGEFWGCSRYPECRGLIDIQSGSRTATSTSPGAVGDGPACPRCKSQMRRRQSARGPFWGCSRFPDCRGIRSMDAAAEGSPPSVGKGSDGLSSSARAPVANGPRNQRTDEPFPEPPPPIGPGDPGEPIW